MKDRINKIAFLVTITLLVAAPWLLPVLGYDYWLDILAEIIIWSLFAASVNLLFGYVGLLSFGQALFFGMGMFGVAGGFAGLAGCLFALFGRYASASYMFYHVSGEGVVWTIVGGAGTLFGPAIGTALLIIVREELSNVWEHYPNLVGVIVIVTVIFAPKGLAGIWNTLLDRFVSKSKESPIQTEPAPVPAKSEAGP